MKESVSKRLDENFPKTLTRWSDCSPSVIGNHAFNYWIVPVIADRTTPVVVFEWKLKRKVAKYILRRTGAISSANFQDSKSISRTLASCDFVKDGSNDTATIALHNSNRRSKMQNVEFHLVRTCWINPFSWCPQRNGGGSTILDTLVKFSEIKNQ